MAGCPHPAAIPNPLFPGPVESQRDSGSQPRVAELARLPWVNMPSAPNRNAVVASLTLHHCDANEFPRHDGHNRVAVGSASIGNPRVVLVPRTNPGLRAATPLALKDGHGHGHGHGHGDWRLASGIWELATHLPA